jgi:threonine dehydrogenase-like Zn-dependent dehydrogenase
MLVSELPEGRKWEIVVDCTGSEVGFNTALGITKPCGTLVLKSTFAGLTPADLTKVKTES